MNQFKIKPTKIFLPKINNQPKMNQNYFIKNITEKKIELNPINNIRLEPIFNKNLTNIKNKYDCLDAEEYISQFQNIPDIYNLIELNLKLKKLNKILIKQGFYFVKTPWNTVWDNNLYAIDYTHEYIYQRYTQTLFDNYDKLYNIEYNDKKKSKKIICMLFVDKLVSYLSISDYSIFVSKICGLLKINCNFVNDEHEKNIIDCLNDFFPQRINYYKNNKLIIINLIKKNY